MALIYIVEDDESIATLIAATLRVALHETRIFPNSAQLEAAIAEKLPHLLMLDIMLPGKNGWDILKDWKADARTCAVPVIILSAKGEEADKVRGLNAGADDYVSKPFGILELQARVNVVLRRITDQSSVLYIHDLVIDVRAKEVCKGTERIHLTRKEMELLIYLCDNRGHVISREQLLGDVWGYHFEGDPTRTVDYHIKSLRQKLGDSAEDSKYIETVRGYGYRLIRDGAEI